MTITKHELKVLLAQGSEIGIHSREDLERLVEVKKFDTAERLINFVNACFCLRVSVEPYLRRCV